MSLLLHATSVARRTPEGWRGLLLTGPSGSGKSDLALRLLDRGWRLVADDYSRVWRSGDSLYATAPEILPEPLRGHVEVRGLGIVAGRNTRAITPVSLMVVCCQAPVERLPEPEFQQILGFSLATLRVDIRPESAPLVLEQALGQQTPGAALHPL